MTVFGVVAAGDTFRDVYFQDFTVDAQNVNAAAHLVWGSYTNADFQINVDTIETRRVNARNVPTTNGHASFQGLVLLYMNGPNGGPATSSTNILLEDCDLHGGNPGFVVAAGENALAVNTYDNITIRRCRHYRGTSTAETDNNFHVGGYAQGGRVTIEDCFGQNAADTGIEVDNATFMTVKNTIIQDAQNASFEYRRFLAAASVLYDEILWENCHATAPTKAVGGNAPGTGLNDGFLIDAAGGFPIGDVSIIDCSVSRANVVAWDTDQDILVTTPLRSLTVHNFTSREIIADTGAVARTPVALNISPGGGCIVDISDVLIVRSGTVSNANQAFVGLLLNTGAVARAGVGNVTVDCSGIAGVGALKMYHTWVSGATIVTGSLHGLYLAGAGSFATSIGLRVDSTASRSNIGSPRKCSRSLAL